VLVGVDEHPVRPAQALAEQFELVAKLGVAVAPGVAREAALSRFRLRRGFVIAERSRDHGSRAWDERLRMARDLGLGHGETHVGEEAALAALVDVSLRRWVRLGGRGADHVDSELVRQALEFGGRHPGIVGAGFFSSGTVVAQNRDGGRDMLAAGGGWTRSSPPRVGSVRKGGV
jgi:hypothetical protein